MKKFWIMAAVLFLTIWQAPLRGNALLDKNNRPLSGFSAFPRDVFHFAGGKINVTVATPDKGYTIIVPIPAKSNLALLQMRFRTTGIRQGDDDWKNGRLGMRFYKGSEPVGPWPDVFSGVGTNDWLDCDRTYDVPKGADFLHLTFANFGTAGKIEFADVSVTFIDSSAKNKEDIPPPNGATTAALWTLDDAWKRTSGTREKICLNGLWQFRPLLDGETTENVPANNSGWGYFKVPGIWPNEPAIASEVFHLSPQMQSFTKSKKLNSAWYRRSVEVPASWNGRKILLSNELIQSCARIYVDGSYVADLYYPGGSVDLTNKLLPGRKHELALLVSALPEANAVYMAADRLITQANELKNRGIGGDMFLESLPAVSAVSDVHVITSYRKRNICFDTGFLSLAPGKYHLKAVIEEQGKNVAEFTSPAFSEKNLARHNGELRFSWTEAWNAPKLWDTDTPENLYTLRLTLLNANGRTIDEFLPQEFGFREFYSIGRDFYLNGKRIYLRALSSSMMLLPGKGTPEVVARTAEIARKLNSNFMFGSNYDYAPGTLAYLAPFHEENSRLGILTALTLPHTKDFDMNLDDPKQRRRYIDYTRHLIRRYQNVPGIIMYTLNHNAMGYYGDQNPLKIGNSYDREKYTRLAFARLQGVNSQKIIKSLDPSRLLYHHAGGKLGDVFTANTYLNWAPRQERDDWFQDWEKNGEMPVFMVEWGLPHFASWSSWRGPEFIWSHPGLQVVWTNEFNASILGEDAYRIDEPKRILARHQNAMVKGNKITYFADLGQHNGLLTRIPDLRKIQTYMVERNIRSMRARGLSALLPFDHVMFIQTENYKARALNPKRFINLKSPGYVPDYLDNRGDADLNLGATYSLTETGEMYRRNSREQLGFIGGRIGDFSENGHNYECSETVRKSLIILNHSRHNAKIPWSWKVPALKLERSGIAEIEAGGRVDVPVEFELPAEFVASQISLEAVFDFADGRTADLLKLDIFPAGNKYSLNSRVGLYDPEGTGAGLLGKLGISFKKVSADADLNDVDLLVIGRNGLEKFPLHLKTRLENGMKLLVLEQPYRTLRGLSLRGNEYALRNVFALESSFHDKPLTDWRGSSTMLEPYLQLPPVEYQDPSWDWEGFTNTRVWRAGLRGSITSVLLEKPSVGNWLPLLHGGFDLQYAPVVEFREGNAIILLSQLDLSGRTVPEPEAMSLLGKMLERLDRAQVHPARKVYYAGSDEGRRLLEDLRIVFAPWTGSEAGKDTLLVVGPGAKLEDIPVKVRGGMRVLGLGLSGAELRLLGMTTPVKGGSYFSQYVTGLRNIPEFAGISNADLHIRVEQSFDAFAENNPGGRLLARQSLGEGVIVAMQLPPWKFDREEFNERTTIRRMSFTVSRLLANLGAPAVTGFAARFDQGVVLPPELPNDKWCLLVDRAGNQKVHLPDYRPGGGWRSVKIGTAFEDQFKDLADYDGIVHYRLEFDLPKSFESAEFILNLGSIDDESWTWVNGQFIGELTQKTNPDNYWIAPRIHTIPKGVLRPGRNVICVRVSDLRGNGGILGTPRLQRAAEPRAHYNDTPIGSDDPYRYYRW